MPHSGSAFAEMLAHTAEHDAATNPTGGGAGSGNIMSSAGGVLSPQAAAVESFYHNTQKKSARGSGDVYVGGAVFPGCYGPLHSVNNREFAIDSNLGHQLQELSFNEMVDLSYMFNYIEPQGRLSKKQVKLQLDESTWSRPFSLDSVGVNQMLTVNNPVRGVMELGFKISVAPGRLAKYTKIVRFLPRFSIVNKLPVNLKILQPTGFAGEAAELDVSAERVRPYHLPAMFGERQIALQLDGGWHRSVAFSIDQIGVFNMEVKRRVNLANIQHVNTRGAPEYSEDLPPMRTLGVYFETDWNEENIVVKGFQKGSFAAQSTDIKVGDVLLSVDDEEVDGKKFELAMNLIRHKLAAEGCTLRFRTVEEKIRLIRESALNTTNRHTKVRKRVHGTPGNAIGAGSSGSGFNHSASMNEMEFGDDSVGSSHKHPSDYVPSGGGGGGGNGGGAYAGGAGGGAYAGAAAGGGAGLSAVGFGQGVKLDMETFEMSHLEEHLHHTRAVVANQRARVRDKDRMVLRVELRQVESSAMIFVQELGAHVNAEYRIENKSVCYKLYYKQKGIMGNSWYMLNPGQSRSYVWEDPFKPHKLLVHSGDNVLSPLDHRAHVASGHAGQFLTKHDGEDLVSAYWGYIAGVNADQATVVSLDEIGSRETMFVSQKTDMKMIATVKSEGPTKILLITPSTENRQVIRELRYCSEFINEQLRLIAKLIENLASLSRYSSSPTTLSSKLSLLESNFDDALVRMKEKQAKLLEIDQALCSGTTQKHAPAAQRPSFGTLVLSTAAEEATTAMGAGSSASVTATTANSGLLSYRPIERVMNYGIERAHQLEVCVLEAKELTSLVEGKMEDVYAKVVIKSEDLTVVTQ